jgi:hypothetical protein
MREMIEQLALRGAPDCSLLIEMDRDIIWPVIHESADVVGGEQRALAYHEAIDVVGLFAWCHRDLLIKRLDAEIDTESDDKSAMSHEQRQRAEAEAMGDLLRLNATKAALEIHVTLPPSAKALKRPCPRSPWMKRARFVFIPFRFHDPQAELMIKRIGAGDELVDLLVRNDHVARLLRIGQSSETYFPCVTVLDPLIMLRASTSAAQTQRQSRLIVAFAIVPSRPSRHCFNSVVASNATGFASRALERCRRGCSAL